MIYILLYSTNKICFLTSYELNYDFNEVFTTVVPKVGGEKL